MVINEGGPLGLARRQLEDAVAALADPVPVSEGGVCRWSESVYVRLRRELSGGRPVRRRRRQTSRLPCRIDVLDLLVDIDTTVGCWEPHAKTTIEGLHQLPSTAAAAVLRSDRRLRRPDSAVGDIGGGVAWW